MYFWLILAFSSAQECGVCCSNLTPRERMFYIYFQDTGHLIGGEGKYAIDTYGYSGNNTDGINGRNNPNAQCVSNIGPAPATLYELGNCSDYMHVNATRPCSFPMNPLNETEMCGRFAIWLHGCQCCEESNPKCDTSVPPCGVCSEGCVIISKNERVKLRTGDLIQIEAYEPKRSGSYWLGAGLLIISAIY